MPRKIFDYLCLCSKYQHISAWNKWHILCAIYVPNGICKVPGCLYAAYGQYPSLNNSFMWVKEWLHWKPEMLSWIRLSNAFSNNTKCSFSMLKRCVWIRRMHAYFGHIFRKTCYKSLESFPNCYRYMYYICSISHNQILSSLKIYWWDNNHIPDQPTQLTVLQITDSSTSTSIELL